MCITLQQQQHRLYSIQQIAECTIALFRWREKKPHNLFFSNCETKKTEPNPVNRREREKGRVGKKRPYQCSDILCWYVKSICMHAATYIHMSHVMWCVCMVNARFCRTFFLCYWCFVVVFLLRFFFCFFRFIVAHITNKHTISETFLKRRRITDNSDWIQLNSNQCANQILRLISIFVLCVEELSQSHICA